jgi:hypothetical protein
MKPTTSLTLLTCALFGSGVSQATLIAYYPFDEGSGTTSANAQGNSALDSTLNASGAWGLGANGTGSSLDVNGTVDGGATVNGQISNAFTNLTITAWINPDVTPQAWTGIFGARGGPQDVGFGFRDTTGQLTYTWNGNNSNTWNWTSNLTVPNNEWSFVALTLSPTGATAYLGTSGGGLVSATNAIPHTTDMSTSIWSIGYDNCCGNRSLDGQIDDLAIWDETLDAASIQSLFTGDATPLTVPEPGVLSLFGALGLLSLLRRRR